MSGYNRSVEAARPLEYQMLQDHTYLDHAGTTLPANSLVDRWMAEMKSTLFPNPHSGSAASQASATRIDEARIKILQFLNASPDEFDLVFVANATAGMKLVMEAFQYDKNGFWYGYHKDSHTSMVGIREAADEHRCFESDDHAEKWIRSRRVEEEKKRMIKLFAYPAQSNLNGRRLPLHWPSLLRQSNRDRTYTLLDAAALVATAQLNLSHADDAPDFTVLSLYKIFGLPNIGALIVRKQSGHVFQNRRYFGGGTVDLTVTGRRWHSRKTESLHDQLEDGTLPIHSIVAIHPALEVHRQLFGSMNQVSNHCRFLAKRLFDGLSSLRHANGLPVCTIYKEHDNDYTDSRIQGPIIAFNLKNKLDGWVANSELEKLAAIKNISLRTGGLCNPGGLASHLQLTPEEMMRNHSEGQHCGNANEIIHGKPAGMARVSLGAMSTCHDVEVFLDFIKEFFVDDNATCDPDTKPSTTVAEAQRLYVESLTIYPIKSCAGWKVPPNKSWPLHKEGLEWDREWCLVQAGSGRALSQKQFPRMALIKPAIDLDGGVMRVSFNDPATRLEPIEVRLASLFGIDEIGAKNATVCGDTITAQVYKSEAIINFFSEALGVACQLARFPAGGSARSSRHAKAHLQPQPSRENGQQNKMPGAFPDPDAELAPRPILLANESPILVISRASVNKVNEEIKALGGTAVSADVFRANIVVADSLTALPGYEQPFDEDSWQSIVIGQQKFRILGSCRRCQMLCVNQETGARGQEPFVTLSKTRRFNGKVLFGQHACHVGTDTPDGSPISQNPTLAVGDPVQPSRA
jgi:molybdenum cofactor sulfurtransferase